MSERKNLNKGRIIILLVFVGLVIFGTFRYITDSRAIAEEGGNGQSQVQKVDVKTTSYEEVRIWSNFSGRIQAVDIVEIKPRVGGTIDKILFKEGSIVKKGAPLFLIDPRTYEAEVTSAEASLESAESVAELAKVELERAEKLLEKEFISESKYDATVNDNKVAAADILAAKARLKQAKLNLEFANIKAPVSGKISRAEITEGNLIQAGNNAPILTTIVSNDQVYAEFDVDEQTYIKTVRKINSNERMPVELTLSSDKTVIYKGYVHSFDNKLDSTSGTIRARAILENSDGALIPGMYADISFGSPEKESVIMVNEKAIGIDQDKRFVYVIDGENKVKYREIQLGESIDGKRVILSGVEEGEKILVNGIQRVRPDTVVEPVEHLES